MRLAPPTLTLTLTLPRTLSLRLSLALTLTLPLPLPLTLALPLTLTPTLPTRFESRFGATDALRLSSVFNLAFPIGGEY